MKTTKKETRVKKLFNLSPMDYAYDNKRWKVFLRDHIGTGLIAKKCLPHSVDVKLAYRHKYDLFAYLRACGFDERADWVHLLVNKMTHPSDFNENVLMLLTISASQIDEWYNLFITNENKHRETTAGKKRL